MSNLKNVFVLAKSLIEVGWTQSGFYACKKGERCDYTDSDADSFCILGAISAACHRLEFDKENVENVIYPFIKEKMNTSSVVYFNDCPNTKKEDVLAFFDALITENSN